MSKIKFQFDPNYDYQLQAVRSVVDLFEGHTPYRPGFLGTEEVVPNIPADEILYDSDIFQNLTDVQDRNQLPTSASLAKSSGMVLEGIGVDSVEFPEFTVEMETGTGKTYCYFRTIYELNKEFGFTKFIIVVPSIAIYEGVYKTDLMTRSHFASLYDNNNLNLIPYDGNRPGQVRGFASSSQIQVLLMTIDSFNKKSNNIFKATDKLQGSGMKPYEFVAATRPIVILDEPQSIDSTEKAKSAIRTLNPLFTLRYSATHRQSPNLVYRLSPVDAYHQGLVKKIEVTGIEALESLSDMLALEGVLLNPHRAKVRTLVIKDGKTSLQTLTLKQNEDLFKHTKREEHRDGFVVEEISIAGDRPFVRFQNQTKIELGGTTVPLRAEIFRAQIRETIIEHLNRQAKLTPLGIKVLSLFFIDKVANFTDEDGIIRLLFDEEFDRLKKTHGLFKNLEASDVRKSYFAKKKAAKKGPSEEIAFDTASKTNEEREAEKAAFKLIMQDKETLLDFNEPTAFIFAHSALKEGWDNPNVFQICTLNQTQAEIKKRQEIGRGLRLCVNDKGERIFDEDVNVLTVIANDSYKHYVEALQTEYLEDGVTEAPPNPSSSKKSIANRNNGIFLSPDFAEFWEKLEKRADYVIQADSKKIVEECVKKLRSHRFADPKIVIRKGEFVMANFKMTLERIAGSTAHINVKIKESNGGEREYSVPSVVGAKLEQVCHEPALRDYKVMEIDAENARVVFENSVELNEYNEVRFDVQLSTKPQESTVDFVGHSTPIFDFISRAASETELTRKTLTEIFLGLPNETQQVLFKNPEGFTNKFIEVVKNEIGRHVAENIQYIVLTGEEVNREELFPPTKHHPQKELIAGGKAGLYDFVQVDSEVERTFVNNNLVSQSDVLFYFKFPPKFRINLPKIISKYNPDWGIVRRLDNSVVNFEVIIETKGGSDLARLRFASEGWKIICAQRFFEELDINYHFDDGRTFSWASFDARYR